MSSEQSIRDEIADEIAGVVVGVGYYSMGIGIDAAQEAADLILASPAILRIRAEALREASDLMLDPEEGLPFGDDEDRAIPSAWLLEQSARIEQSSEGNVAPNPYRGGTA